MEEGGGIEEGGSAGRRGDGGDGGGGRGAKGRLIEERRENGKIGRQKSKGRVEGDATGPNG